jgi:ABC-type uncharacterized transport system auxiliary subunit
MLRTLCLLTVMLALAACGERDEDTDLLAPQREALERAEGVEQTLLDAAERQQRQIEEQGGG